MKTLIHKILYRTLPLEGYLRAVSRLFFFWQRLGIGRYAPATEYVYHLPQLVRAATRPSTSAPTSATTPARSPG